MKSWAKWSALALSAYALDPELGELLVWAAVAIVVALVELAGVIITARAKVDAARELAGLTEDEEDEDDE